MDTPERGQPWWKRARKELRAITENRTVSIVIFGFERNPNSGRETKGTRYEAEIFLLDGTIVNEVMVREGFARAWCDEPDEKLRERFGKLQLQGVIVKSGV